MNVRITVLLFIVLVSVTNLWSEELVPEEIFNAALQKDHTLQTLLLESKTNLLKIEVEDYKEGISLKTGIDEDGSSVEGLGSETTPKIKLNPFLELTLPETTGTSLKAEVPITIKSWSSTDTVASLSFKQELNSLLNIEKQD
ncbi:MAG: hypothetical protein PQJ46_02255, partial [Spirochaetales bacterium]|nr:hypothetical protein [Spirochaetales bacterium]